MSSAIVTNLQGRETELFSCSGDVRLLRCGDADKPPAQLQYMSADAGKSNVVALITPGYRDDVIRGDLRCVADSILSQGIDVIRLNHGGFYGCPNNPDTETMHSHIEELKAVQGLIEGRDVVGVTHSYGINPFLHAVTPQLKGVVAFNPYPNFIQHYTGALKSNPKLSQRFDNAMTHNGQFSFVAMTFLRHFVDSANDFDVMSAVKECSDLKPKVGVVYNESDKLVEGAAKRLGEEPGFVKRWIDSVSSEGFDVSERAHEGGAHIVDETLCAGLVDILYEWDYV